jgi:hypothetical protein
MTLRALAGAALLAVFALWWHAEFLRDLPWRAVPGADEVSRAERRLGAIRGELPARGTVGYRAESPSADPEIAEVRYHQAQYVLSPLIVEHSSRVPLVIDGDNAASVSHSEGP